MTQNKFTINTKLINYLANIFLIITILFFVISLLFIKDHDWDIDAFLYIGSRLWEGELLYLYDFETKLPLVQYLFSLASIFGGVGAWRLMTAVITGLFTILGSHVLAKLMVSIYFPRISYNYLRYLYFSVFLILIYSLPGSDSSQLEMISASSAFVSLSFLLEYSSKNNLLKLFLSSIFLAIAACIRPNYIYVLPIAFLYVLFVDIDLSSKNSGQYKEFFKQYLIKLILINVGFFGIVAIQITPYLFVTNGIKSLIEGISAIAMISDGINFKQLMSSQFVLRTIVFYFGLYTSCILSVLYIYYFNYKNFKYLLSCSLLCIFCIFAINISLLRNHYWGHNSIMFVPYAVPLFVFMLLAIFKNDTILNLETKKLHNKIISFIFLLIMICLISTQGLIYVRAVKEKKFEFNFYINDRRIDYELLNYLKKSNKSFYVIDSPIYHMILKKNRIGDGHPAMYAKVLSGKRLGPINNISLYSDYVYYDHCLSLINSEKQLIIINSKSDFEDIIIRCLDNKNSGYEKNDIDNLENYIVFIKK